MNHIEIYGYFMLANFMLLSDGKNPWQMKPLQVNKMVCATFMAVSYTHLTLPTILRV